MAKAAARLYLHHADTTLVLPVATTTTVSALIQEFCAEWQRKGKPALNSSCVRLQNDANKLLRSETRVLDLVDDRGDLFVMLTEPTPSQSSSSAPSSVSIAPSAPVISMPSASSSLTTIAPSPAPKPAEKPPSAASIPASPSTPPLASCLQCHSIVLIPRDSAKVTCSSCNAPSVVVETVIAQLHCEYCHRLAYSRGLSPVIYCQHCKREYLFSSCPKCEAPFGYPAEWREIECASCLHRYAEKRNVKDMVDNAPKRLFALAPFVRPRNQPLTWLLTQYYVAKEPARQKELNTCLQKNLACTLFDVVYVLLEKESDREHFLSLFPLASNPRLRVASFGKRLTYNAAFELLTTETLPGTLCVLANLDIYFDGSLAFAPSLLSGSPPAFIALTRHDELPDGSLRFQFALSSQSQDAWIWISPLPAAMLQRGKFELGRPGCDNRIAAEAEEAGMRVKNPAYTLLARHLHESQIRHYTQKDKVEGRYLFVNATE